MTNQTTNQHKILNLNEIMESSTNPRKHFDRDKLDELASSIGKHGVIQPIVVRVIPSDGVKEQFSIVAGARRFRASKLAKKETIPAIVVAMTDQEVLEVQVIENLQRDDLHPLEEAEGYHALVTAYKYTPHQLAAKVGKSVSYIRKRLQLLTLAEEAKKAFYDGRIQLGHALIIATVGPDQQVKLLKYIQDENPTLATLSRHIHEEVMIHLTMAPFKLSDPKLNTVAGACTVCPYNTKNDSDLFGDAKGDGMCTHPKCFQDKVRTHLVNIRVEEEKKGNKVLSVTESRDVFKYNMLYSNDYVKKTDKCFSHPKEETYGKLFTGLVPEYLVLDEKNNLHRLFKKNEVEKAKEESDWYKRKQQNNSSQTVKNRRDSRRSKIAGELLEKAIMGKVEKDIGVPLLGAGVISNLNFYGNFDEIILEIDPSADTNEHQDEDELRELFIKHFGTIKNQKDQMLFLVRLLLCDGRDFNEHLEKLYGLSESKFKARAKQIEEKEWKAEQAKAKKSAKKGS